MNLTDLLKAESRRLTELHEGGSAPDALARRIGRRRALVSGTATGGALAIVALLAATVTPSRHEPAPATPPVDPFAITAYASVPACGEPAPTPTGSPQGMGFVLHSTGPFRLFAPDGAVTLTGKLTAARDDAPVVLASTIGSVWTRDGVVVGYGGADEADMRVFDDVTWTMPLAVGGELTAQTLACTRDGGAAGPLPPGTYAVVPVLHVESSPALADAHAQGLGPAGPGVVADYRYDVSIPTLASGADAYDATFDVTLIAAPVQVTITGH